MLKPLKQKLFVDGLSYLLQEIYGLENKVMLIHMLYRFVLKVKFNYLSIDTATHMTS